MNTRPPPNIVLILTDEQHADALGFRGQLPVPTPHADRLAREGQVFDQAFCCASICSPSRAALLTGCWPHRFGMVANNLTLRAGAPNLASLLGAAGYRLGYAGKWHADHASVPTDHGFAGHNFPGYGYPVWLYREQSTAKKTDPYADYLRAHGFPIPRVTEAAPTFAPDRQSLILHGRLDCPVEATIQYYVAEQAVRFIRDSRAPFFLWVNFFEPHNPCYLPEPYYSLINPRDIPEPVSFRAAAAGQPYVQERLRRYWGVAEAPWSWWQEHLARYLGACALIDAQVGRIRAALEATGQWENTILIFASDHGDMLGRHRLLDKGPFMYDDTYRVPLIVRGPGIPAGRCAEFVYLQEFFPTILDWAGVAAPADADFTRSLRPVLDRAGANWTPRAEVFGEFDQQIALFPQRMIRTRSHKFIFNESDRSELYDLERDPHELTNVAGHVEYAAIQRELAERLLAHLKQTRDPRARLLEACRANP
jgi:arylsulfatase A-like enzyme